MVNLSGSPGFPGSVIGMFGRVVGPRGWDRWNEGVMSGSRVPGSPSGSPV